MSQDHLASEDQAPPSLREAPEPGAHESGESPGHPGAPEVPGRPGDVIVAALGAVAAEMRSVLNHRAAHLAEEPE